MALYKYGFQPGEGLYTNMNAIRRDEELDNLHSCYVDQWDWEKVIKKEERTVETLEATVRNIFKIIKHMEHEVWYKISTGSKENFRRTSISLLPRNWKTCIRIKTPKGKKKI